MDNYIDKLAQKFTAGEVIRANSVTEEREFKRLREQVAEYERCLQEMRKIQMIHTQTAQNLHDLMVESTENMRKLMQESMTKIDEVQSEADRQKTESGEQVETVVQMVERMEEKAVTMQDTVVQLTGVLEKNQKEIAEWFKQADEFLHKENVKVYRNVQAVVVNELESKAETIIKAQEDHAKKYSKPVFAVAILGVLTAAASLVLQILELVGTKM